MRIMFLIINLLCVFPSYTMEKDEKKENFNRLISDCTLKDNEWSPKEIYQKDLITFEECAYLAYVFLKNQNLNLYMENESLSWGNQVDLCEKFHNFYPKLYIKVKPTKETYDLFGETLIRYPFSVTLIDLITEIYFWRCPSSYKTNKTKCHSWAPSDAYPC